MRTLISSLRLFTIAAAALLSIQTAQSAVVVAVPIPGFEVTYNLLVSGGTPSNPDVRGTAVLTNPSTGSNAFLTDFGVPSSPNTALLGVALGPEVLYVAFDFSGTTFSPDLLKATIPGTGIPVTAITNDTLTQLVGTVPYNFEYSLSTPVAPGVSIETYVLVSAGIPVSSNVIPEPQTFATAGLAAATLGVLIVRRRRARAL